MSFSCTTRLKCDVCGTTLISSGVRMHDCASKLYFEKHICKQKGWKVVHSKYHVCKECAEYYGMKNLKFKFKFEEEINGRMSEYHKN